MTPEHEAEHRAAMDEFKEIMEEEMEVETVKELARARVKIRVNCTTVVFSTKKILGGRVSALFDHVHIYIL